MAKTNTTPPKVSVVIPSWNSQKQLKQNLPYVYKAASKVNAEIIVIDDASKLDNSWEYLQSQRKLGKLRCYLNKTNLGFSATVNRGVSLAKSTHIILLNTDVRPSIDCFANSLELFVDPDVFAVGFNSSEAWMGGEWGGGLFHHFKVEPTRKNSNKINPSLWASGGQAAFDKKKWIALGGMNSLYAPFYWEDVDLGYSAWKRGWKVLWSPDCKCVHDHKKSVISNNFSTQHIHNIAQRNQFLFIWKNISDPKMLFDHIIRLPIFFLRYPRQFIHALLRLPQAIRERNKQKTHWVKSDSRILTQWAR